MAGALDADGKPTAMTLPHDARTSVTARLFGLPVEGRQSIR